MPKDTEPRSTRKYRDRVTYILRKGVEMAIPCSRCKEKGLRCVVELSTGFCAFCIRSRNRCSLVLTNTERNEMDEKRRQTELDVARLEASLAVKRLELLELKEKQRVRELEDIASTEELERLERAAGIRIPSPSPERNIGPITGSPDLWADLGWSQADFNSFDPSFLLVASPLGPEVAGLLDGSPSPVSEPAVSSGA